MFPNKRIQALQHKGALVVMTKGALEHGVLFVDEEGEKVSGWTSGAIDCTARWQGYLENV